MDVELLPHAFVNIPDEKMHIGVFIIYFIFISLMCILIFVYIFVHNFLPSIVQL
jgi:hypothetical protein